MLFIKYLQAWEKADCKWRQIHPDGGKGLLLTSVIEGFSTLAVVLDVVICVIGRIVVIKG